MIYTIREVFTLCLKPYFSLPSQQAFCQAQRVDGRYLPNPSCLLGLSGMRIDAKRLNETKLNCSCPSEISSLEVSTATRNGRKRKSQTPAVWCHLSCLCKCISSLMFLAMATNQLGRVSAFSREWRGGGTFIHIHSCLWSLLGSSN